MPVVECILRIDGVKVSSGTGRPLIDRSVQGAGNYLLSFTRAPGGDGKAMTVEDRRMAKVFHSPEAAQAMIGLLPSRYATTILPKGG
jgi:hypothetical protein